MAKTRKRNPKGALLINPRGSGSKRVKRTKRALSLAGLLNRVANPHKKRRATKRRNPLVMNPRKHHKRRSTRRNPLVINPRKRHHKRHAAKRRNPLVVNPKRHRRAKRGYARRHNPLVVNPAHSKRHRKGRKGYRRNPLVVNPASGVIGKVQGTAVGFAKKIPLVGGVLATALTGLSGAVGGALGVLPAELAMPYVGRYMPSALKPFGYTIVGLGLSAIVKVVPYKFPMKNELAVGLAAAGGAVDMFRYRHGQSQTLAGADDTESWGDPGEIGDVGDEGAPLAATEYGDADLADADYIAGDFSAEELAAIELGRQVFWRRFAPGGMAAKRAAERAGESPSNAGLPGLRWGWLIYWVGFDAVQRLAQKPPAERVAIIEDLKREAHLRAHRLLQMNEPSNVQSAETAGLLATTA